MRLLKRDGERLVFETANETAFTTPYAILSHTWGKEEVEYKDVLAGRSNRKILFTLEQAARDGIEHVWVDTCCIDKTNSSELSESINLMWKWYANSTVCYVYLHGALAGNRWFTRGWTLQELIAPKEVLFFRDEKEHGSRRELVDVLHKESGVDKAVLGHYMRVEQVPVVERYRWAQDRETSKQEDLMYCLLGLLGVALPLNYGGGLDSVREDLLEKVERQHGRPVSNELRLVMLPRKTGISPEALMAALRFKTMADRKEHISLSVKGTCDWLLEQPEFSAWLVASQEHTTDELGFLWIKGHPGAGKSTLMKFADGRTADDRTQQISYYFNARGSHLDKSIEGLFRSLLAQLLNQDTALQRQLCQYLEHTNRSLPQTWSIALLQTLIKMSADTSNGLPVRCFVDALDEGELAEVKTMVIFLDALAHTARRKFSVCFASRYYPTLTINNCIELRLEEKIQHQQAVEQYIRRCLQVEDDELGRSLIQQLMAKARGIFMWVVLVIKQLNDELDKGRLHALSALIDSLPSELHDLYQALIARMEDLEEFKLCVQLMQLSDPPLTGIELYCTIQYGLGRIPADFREYPSPYSAALKRFVSHTSRGLAEIVGDSAQFIHETIRDYFLNGGLQELLSASRQRSIAASHHRIQQILVNYLSSLRLNWKGDHLRLTWLASGKCLVLWDYRNRGRRKYLDEAREQASAQVPLVPRLLRRLLYHAEQCSPHFDQASLLEGLDWSTAKKLLPGAHSRSQHQPVELHVYTLLVMHQAFHLASRVFECPTHIRIELLGPIPLHETCIYGYADGIMPLLSHGYHVDTLALHRKTPLALALLCGRTKIAILLIRSGAHLGVLIEGKTLLLHALSQRMYDVVQALIQRGVDPNECMSEGRTALMECCSNISRPDAVKAVRALIAGGAVIDARDDEGKTALFYCDDRGARILLESGADVNAHSNKGETVLSQRVQEARSEFREKLHSEFPNLDLILVLLSHGACLRQSDARGGQSGAQRGQPERSDRHTARVPRLFGKLFHRREHDIQAPDEPSVPAEVETLLDRLLAVGTAPGTIQKIDYNVADSFDRWVKGPRFRYISRLGFDHIAAFRAYNQYLRDLGQWDNDVLEESRDRP